jgi:hypothetical protein
MADNDKGSTFSSLFMPEPGDLHDYNFNAPKTDAGPPLDIPQPREDIFPAQPLKTAASNNDDGSLFISPPGDIGPSKFVSAGAGTTLAPPNEDILPSKPELPKARQKGMSFDL